jgi:magnesium transporter
MIHVTLLEEGCRTVHGGPELLARPGPHWVDVEAPTAEEMALLKQRFGLHRLAVEDVLHLDQRPKVEEYPGHLFLVLQGFVHAPPAGVEGARSPPALHELHFLLGPDWLVTAHDLPSPAVRQARARVEADPAATLGRGCDFVMYLVADALVDEDFPVLDAAGDALEELEEAIFENARPEHLERLLQLKRQMAQMRRVLAPQREAVGLLARRAVPHLHERTALYFRDVADHLSRLYERIDMTRDMLGNAMDVYLSMLANRSNDVTKQLTIFSTIFLPLSFVTGFFGQNFEVLSRPVFFWLMLGVVVAFPLGLVVWFRRKKWL